MKDKSEKQEKNRQFDWEPLWDFCGVVATITFCTISAVYVAITIVSFLTSR